MLKNKLVLSAGVSALAVLTAFAFVDRSDTGNLGVSAASAQESGSQQGNQGGQGQGGPDQGGQGQGAMIDRTDGISFEFARWRFNLRTSNTEPLVRLNVESRGDAALMQQKTAELLALLEPFAAGGGAGMDRPG